MYNDVSRWWLGTRYKQSPVLLWYTNFIHIMVLCPPSALIFSWVSTSWIYEYPLIGKAICRFPIVELRLKPSNFAVLVSTAVLSFQNLAYPYRPNPAPLHSNLVSFNVNSRILVVSYLRVNKYTIF